MPQRDSLVVDRGAVWAVLADGGQELGGGLAGSPLSMPMFFLGWVALGVVVALGLARRGTTGGRWSPSERGWDL
jgi:hypothetical protein